MCQPETRQAYFVLQAFKNSGKFVGHDELISELSEVLEENEFDSLYDVGPDSLSELMNVAANEDAIEPDDTGKFKLTEHGARQLLVFKELVNSAEPKVA